VPILPAPEHQVLKDFGFFYRASQDRTEKKGLICEQQSEKKKRKGSISAVHWGHPKNQSQEKIGWRRTLAPHRRESAFIGGPYNFEFWMRSTGSAQVFDFRSEDPLGTARHAPTLVGENAGYRFAVLLAPLWREEDIM
jgi:hypothetical protein